MSETLERATGFGAPPPDRPVPVQLHLLYDLRRNRLTALVRLVLAVPHLVVLYVLGIAAEVVVFLGWFAALVLGRLPEWVHEFVSGVLAWTTRVWAYVGLLTDEYPPFQLVDSGHAARPVFTQQPLNRLAVLFRIVLMLPAYLVAALVGYGMVPLGLAAWVCAVVLGRIPAPLWQGLAAGQRFALRNAAFAAMLTPTYPGGLYGDRPAVPAAPAQADWAQPAPVEPAPEPVPAPEADDVHDFDWVLSRGGRVVVTVGLVLGVLAPAGVVAGAVVAGSGPVDRQQALNRVQAAHDRLGTALSTFQQEAQTCQSAADQVGCITGADRRLAAAVVTFRHDLDAVDLPAGADAAAGRVDADCSRLDAALRDLAAATSLADYRQRAEASNIDTIGNTFDRDYATLTGLITSG